MFDVYICYAGCKEKVNRKPLSLLEAMNMVDDNHSETQRDLEKLLKKPSCVGLHEVIRERLQSGDEYIIENHAYGTVLCSAHRGFEGWC